MSNDVFAGTGNVIDLSNVGATAAANIIATHRFSLSQERQVLYRADCLSRTWDQWLATVYCMQLASLPYLGMIPVAYHIYVDGSYYRQNYQADWAFVVVVKMSRATFA